MKCSKCGAKNPKGDKFCGGCGAKLTKKKPTSGMDTNTAIVYSVLILGMAVIVIAVLAMWPTTSPEPTPDISPETSQLPQIIVEPEKPKNTISCDVDAVEDGQTIKGTLKLKPPDKMIMDVEMTLDGETTDMKIRVAAGYFYMNIPDINEIWYWEETSKISGVSVLVDNIQNMQGLTPPEIQNSLDQSGMSGVTCKYVEEIQDYLFYPPEGVTLEKGPPSETMLQPPEPEISLEEQYEEFCNHNYKEGTALNYETSQIFLKGPVEYGSSYKCKGVYSDDVVKDNNCGEIYLYYDKDPAIEIIAESKVNNQNCRAVAKNVQAFVSDALGKDCKLAYLDDIPPRVAKTPEQAEYYFTCAAVSWDEYGGLNSWELSSCLVDYATYYDFDLSSNLCWDARSGTKVTVNGIYYMEESDIIVYAVDFEKKYCGMRTAYTYEGWVNC